MAGWGEPFDVVGTGDVTWPRKAVVPPLEEEPPMPDNHPGPFIVTLHLDAGDTSLSFTQRDGFAPDSSYVDRFWTPILGPSSTLLWRRLVDAGAGSPKPIDLDEIGRQIGIVRLDRIKHAVKRIAYYDLAEITAEFRHVLIRDRAPRLSPRRLSNLPPSLVAEHARWANAELESLPPGGSFPAHAIR